jgi:hypothetical protein
MRMFSQPPSRPPTLVETLNKEAEAGDPDGIRSYSAHLMELIIAQKAGVNLINSLSGRLAIAEAEARDGKRKLISEIGVAQAFNELMAMVGAAPNLRASATDVKRLRIAFEPAAPALISRTRNNESCYPGEALFLVELLMDNTGLEVPPLREAAQSPHSEYRGFAQPEARANLTRFVSGKSRRTVGKAFTQLATALNF